jgi:hypothetical protein
MVLTKGFRPTFRAAFRAAFRATLIFQIAGLNRKVKKHCVKKANLKNLGGWVLPVLLLITVGGCLNSASNHSEGEGSLHLFFEHRAGDVVLEFDTLAMVNSAGNRYSVSKLRYVVSDFRFRDSTGQVVWQSVKQSTGHSPSALLIDARDPQTLSAIFKNIPTENIHDFLFTFGLEGEANATGAQPKTEEWLNFAWPSIWGGGYHFMQLEGRFIDSTGMLSAYAAHIGSRSLPDAGVMQKNHWQAGPFLVEKTFGEGATLTTTLVMDVKKWFQGITDYDMNDYFDAVMNNGGAQEVLKANGKSGVFSLKEFLIP